MIFGCFRSCILDTNPHPAGPLSPSPIGPGRHNKLGPILQGSRRRPPIDEDPLTISRNTKILQRTEPELDPHPSSALTAQRHSGPNRGEPWRGRRAFFPLVSSLLRSSHSNQTSFWGRNLPLHHSRLHRARPPVCPRPAAPRFFCVSTAAATHSIGPGLQNLPNRESHTILNIVTLLGWCVAVLFLLYFCFLGGCQPTPRRFYTTNHLSHHCWEPRREGPGSRQTGTVFFFFFFFGIFADFIIPPICCFYCTLNHPHALYFFYFVSFLPFKVTKKTTSSGIGVILSFLGDGHGERGKRDLHDQHWH